MTTGAGGDTSGTATTSDAGAAAAAGGSTVEFASTSTWDDCGGTNIKKDDDDDDEVDVVTTFELEALFVEPTFVGKGIGTQLFQHAIQHAIPRMINEEDTTKNEVDEHQNVTPIIVLNIQSDPYAERFYLKQGCTKVGQRESDSIPGRFLPLLQYKL